LIAPDNNTWSRIIAQNDDIVSRDIAGQTILVPIRGNLADMQNIFTLNKIGAFIWEKLDGETPLSKTLGSVLEHFEVSSQEAENDILEFIGQILETGLAVEKN
jgi:hypothetical protein